MSEYLDTSVVVKWFKEGEEQREEALKLRERVINFDTEFVMSYYGLLELVRALVKSGFPENKIKESFQSLQDLYDIGALRGVGIVPVLYLARDIEIKLHLYASDALHLASAVSAGCDVFWSADTHHLKAKTRTYLNAYNIQVKSLLEAPL